MKNYDDVEMAKDGDTGEIVFTAVKTSKTRNLEGDTVETEQREEIARLPDNREIGMEIGQKLCEKYTREPMEGKSVSQKMDEVYNR